MHYYILSLITIVRYNALFPRMKNEVISGRARVRDWGTKLCLSVCHQIYLVRFIIFRVEYDLSGIGKLRIEGRSGQSFVFSHFILSFAIFKKVKLGIMSG